LIAGLELCEEQQTVEDMGTFDKSNLNGSCERINTETIIGYCPVNVITEVNVDTEQDLLEEYSIPREDMLD
jgi:hypothetical protein